MQGERFGVWGLWWGEAPEWSNGAREGIGGSPGIAPGYLKTLAEPRPTCVCHSQLGEIVLSLWPGKKSCTTEVPSAGPGSAHVSA